MSQASVIYAVDETLRSLLADNLDPDSVKILDSDVQKHISFKPPHRLITDNPPSKNYLSLFLYRVVENGEVKNRPLEPRNGNLFQFPSLALNLFYLVTPLLQDKDSDDIESPKNTHKLLGKVMQIFHDNSILKGAALQEAALKDAHLSILLNPISLEDITKLWSSFMRPYYLSVSYEVKVVYIDSERVTEVERVRRKQIQYQQFPGGS